MLKIAIFVVTKLQKTTTMSTDCKDTKKRKRYSSDMSENGWEKLNPILEQLYPAFSVGRPRSVSLKEVLNAIFYVVKNGCVWRDLPKDFPAWQTVYKYYIKFCTNGIWEFISCWFTKKHRREDLKRTNEKPTAAIIDSQSVKNGTFGSEECGYDGGKNVKGIKRFILVDTQGLVLAVFVCAANVSEKEGALKFMQHIKNNPILKDLCSNLLLVWADGGYRGEELVNVAKSEMGWEWEVVLRSDTEKGFKVIPKRWVVERTFGWFNHYRRLAKNYEYRTDYSENLLYIVNLAIILKRL